MVTLLGTVLFAALATAWPLVRFSGHADMDELARLAGEGAWAVLVLTALLKALATAINLASGWRGGAIFPLIFAGGAAGAACLAVLTELHPTAAIVAGLGAAATVGLRKPLAVLLICAFSWAAMPLGPLIVGVGVGMLASSVLAACTSRASTRAIPRKKARPLAGLSLFCCGPSGRLVETCPCAGSYGAVAPSDPRPRGTCHPSASGAGQHATQSHRRGARSCGSALPRWRDSSRDRHRCRFQSSPAGGIAPGARRPHTAGDHFRCRGARHGSALCERSRSNVLVSARGSQRAQFGII